MSQRTEFKLEMELDAISPDEVIAGFKAARDIPIETLMQGLLEHNMQLTLLCVSKYFPKKTS